MLNSKHNKGSVLTFCLPLIIAFLMSACVKDKPQDIVEPQIQLTNSKKVYIINEGIFTNGNSSISLYDTGNDNVIENYYKTQNSASPVLGDVAQSLTKINGSFYIVVNNSGKIIICDDQFKKTNQISNLSSPRYILQITNQKAYVSDYNANAISIVNLNSNTKTGSIPCPGWTENMVFIYNKAFITNMKRNFTYIVNTINDQIIDSINVGVNAGNITIDKNDKIWILSSGDNSKSILPKLLKINPMNYQVEVTFTFNMNDWPNNLCLNKSKDTLYFVNGGIFKMPISSTILPNNALIAKGSKNFYGLGIDGFTIYAADAVDYVQKSNIYAFDASGNQKKIFKAGINANGFYFD